MEKRFLNEKILVTGGLGFVGSNIVNRLVDEGAKVTVLDDYFTGAEKNLKATRKVKIVRGSVTDKRLVHKLVNDNHIVFHLAARNIIASIKDPLEDFQTNTGGVLNLLISARDNTKLKKFVYTSSTSVYGNATYLPINELDRFNLLSPYAASKLGGENYCMVFYENYGVPTSIVRYSNVYGPNQRPENPYSGVIAKFFDWANAGESLKIHGDGEQTRDFSFIDDVVEATILAALVPKSVGEVYNVASGIETSVNKLADLVITLFESKSKKERIDRRDIDNVRRRVLNIEKARKDLRWTPKTTLLDGLELTKKWYLEDKKSKV